MKASLSVRPVLPYVFNDKTFKGTNWHQMKQKVHIEYITKLLLTAVLSDILYSHQVLIHLSGDPDGGSARGLMILS